MTGLSDEVAALGLGTSFSENVADDPGGDGSGAVPGVRAKGTFGTAWEAAFGANDTDDDDELDDTDNYDLIGTPGETQPKLDTLQEAPSEAFAAAAQLNQHAGPPGAIELTMVSAANGWLTKSYTLAADCSIVTDAAAEFPSSGWFLRWQLPHTQPMATLARGITGVRCDEALMLGQLGGTAMARRLMTVRRWNALSGVERGGAAGDVGTWINSAGPLARGKVCFPSFRSGVPAIMGIDIDVKDLPQQLQDLIEQAGGILAVLAAHVPGLAGAGQVSRASVSTGIVNTKTGYRKPASGLHLYIAVRDGGDIPRLLRALFGRLLLAGFGFAFLTLDGKFLPRTIFDVAASGDPCRLLYEALAVLGHPDLAHDPAARCCSVREGPLLDTRTVIDLTDAEQAQVAGIVSQLREDSAAEALELKRKHFGPLIAARQKLGETPEAAERHVFAAIDAGRLPLDGVYPFSDGTKADGWAILADPQRFIGKVGPDPVENTYGGGGNKVILHRRSPQRGIWRGGILFHSKAHHGINRILAYDAADVVRLVERMTGSCAARITRLTEVYATLYEAIDADQAVAVLAAARIPSEAAIVFGDPDELLAASLLAMLAAADWPNLARLRAVWGVFFDLALDEARAAADAPAAMGLWDAIEWDQAADRIAAAAAALAAEIEQEAAKDRADSDSDTERDQAAARMAWLRGETSTPLDQRAAVDAVMRELNARYAVTMSDGSIMEEVFDAQLGRYSYNHFTFHQFREMHNNVQVPTGKTKLGEPVFTPKGTLWTQHKNRLDYRRVVFDPSGQHHPVDYNLWRGFGLVPRSGDWSLLRQHMMDVICAGVTLLYEYLVKWIARMVQFPALLGEVAIVLRGVEGTGKGILGRTLATIMGTHGMQITSGVRLTSQFNHHLRGLVYMFADEATFAGDRSAWGHIKGLITEPTMMIERKYGNAEVFPNFLHFLMASNEAWVVPADSGSRRWCVFDTVDQWPGIPEPERRVKEQAYFTPVYRQLDAGGREAMLHELLDMDLTGFNVRAYPVTDALLAQREQSLPTHEAWWTSVLSRGFVWESERGLDDHFGQWHPVVSTRLLYNAYKRFARGKVADHGRLLSLVAFGRLMVRMGGRPHRARNAVIGERARSMFSTGELERSARQERGYDFGSLAESRGTFAKVVMPLGWDDDADADDDATAQSKDDDSPF